MKQERTCLLLLFFIFLLMLTSCNSNDKIQGLWKSTERNIIIADKQFEIVFNAASNVTGLRGDVEYKSNVLEIQFKEYKSNKNDWISIDNTELKNYKERIRYRIKGKTLETYIESTGKIYVYVR